MIRTGMRGRFAPRPTSNIGHYVLCFLIALIFIAVGWFTGVHLFATR